MMPDGAIINRHNDDQGHLLDRTGNASDPDYQDSPLAAADPDHFLDWFPGASMGLDAGSVQTPVTAANALESDFQGMVTGVHQFGCGVESQLESWYRFLIQPDPYASLALDASGRAQWKGFDTTILAQRAAFLRPDSLVAVIVLTDENDSEVDVRSLGGKGWQFMDSTWGPPRGTSACANDPNDPNCTSCGFAGHESDPACKMGPYSSQNDWGFNLNLRHVHEKQKYGVDVQFPIERYVVGLTSSKVPDRNGEYPIDESGNYPATYQGLANLDCTNPLYAAKLPSPDGADPASWNPSAKDLCNLPPGTRDPSLVFYAHIGGVPHQLLQNADGTQKDTLSDADWQLILGNDPEKFDYTGIDPHMIEAFAPRTSVQVPGRRVRGVAGDVARGDRSRQRPRVDHGLDGPRARGRPGRPRIRVHLQADRPEYGARRRRGTAGPPRWRRTRRSASSAIAWRPARELVHARRAARRVQFDDADDAGLRESVPHDPRASPGEAARQGPGRERRHRLVALSDSHRRADARRSLFGYRPAMNSIVNSLRKALAPECLPERLPKAPDATGALAVPCLVLGTFPPGNNAPTDCSSLPGTRRSTRRCSSASRTTSTPRSWIRAASAPIPSTSSRAS